ncbi:hypothetical protein ScalyP_jg7975 [Parmales sp. scaly parma]|nr:hypothetical protein ScalyP_jg7975 [Parmales sp. scaly parma]
MSKTLGYDNLFKILLVGDTNVGKSSLLLRFTDDTFDSDITSTIGVDFKVKHLTLDDPNINNDTKKRRVKISVWDTAGQERFRTLTSAYYRGAQCVVLVFDCSNTESFENLSVWLEEVNKNSSKNVVKLCIVNKIDLNKERAITKEAGENWAMENEMLYCEASAKSDIGVQDVFREAVRQICANEELLQGTASKKNSVTLSPISDNNEPPGGCC